MLAFALLGSMTAAQVDFPDRCPAPLLATSSHRGRVITAPSGGVVRAATDDALEVQLCAYENHLVRDVRLTVRGGRHTLTTGATVNPGDELSRGGVVTLDGLSPAAFFEQHPFLYDPKTEPVLVVVNVEGHEARRYERGQRTHAWEVGRGQAEGVKTMRGDLKTPRGLYFVTDKSTGPFSGDFAGYYGGHWVKVNYPNAFDASRGVQEQVISSEQAATIARTWWRRGLTAQKTKLGGGIGFHGWIAPWRAEVEGFGLSWGCVVLHPEDVAGFYATIPVGAAVVLE